MRGFLKRSLLLVGMIVFIFFMHFRVSHALSVDDVIRLKEAGVSDETIQLLIKLEMEKLRARREGMGSYLTKDPDGTERIIIRSGESIPKEPRGEEDQTWEKLKHVIIDAR